MFACTGGPAAITDAGEAGRDGSPADAAMTDTGATEVSTDTSVDEASIPDAGPCATGSCGDAMNDPDVIDAAPADSAPCPSGTCPDVTTLDVADGALDAAPGDVSMDVATIDSVGPLDVRGDTVDAATLDIGADIPVPVDSGPDVRDAIVCMAGMPCAPATACHAGVIVCTSGVPTCMDTGTFIANGTACGAGRVCSAGNCASCSAGVSCVPANICHNGTTSCATGTSVCMDTGSNVANGTACGVNRVCNAGTCATCTAGLACVPGNPCHLGSTSCAPGVSTCVDTGTTAPNYTACGGGQVCTGGVCGACVSGGACTPSDPCALGTFSCATSTCVAGGPNPTRNGLPCGTSGAGVCTGGACVCPAGQGFNAGDCQACPSAFSRLYVDARPGVGADVACCGVNQVAGFAGPCRTVTEALRRTTGSNFTIVVTGDASGNASPTEVYPIRPHSAVSITGNVCFPGVAGARVFSVDTDFGSVSLNSLIIGTNCAGVGAGATDAVYVGGISNTFGARPTLTLNATRLQGTRNGLHVDGGVVTLVGSVFISNVSADGILCRSDWSTSVTSRINPAPFGSNTLTIDRAAAHDIFAGDTCDIRAVRFTLGVAAPCPAVKPDSYGIWVEGTGFVSGSGTISCMNNDAISLRNNPALTTNTPTFLTTGGTTLITRSGCAGIYAEVGGASMFNATISNNHWGAIQRSSSASTDPANALLRLNGTSTTTGNSFRCNNRMEPGACCTATSCPNGYDVWNNSGLPLGASFNAWEDDPVSQCRCNASLASCTCTGLAAGMTTPPDGLSVVNSPFVAGGTAGTTTTTSNSSVMPPSGCF